MKFVPDRCPECGKPPRGTLDTIPGVAEFVYDDDSNPMAYEYSGNTDIFWDGQTTDVDEYHRWSLVCSEGHDWYAEKVE